MFFGRKLRKAFPTLAELSATLRFHTYIGDGLITRHAAECLDEARFCQAYASGKATKSWAGMDPRWRAYTACWAASHAANLAGDFVECGVNRGGMSLTIMQYLNFNQLNRKFFLLDTYCGVPAGLQGASANHGCYAECYADVVKTFVPYPNAVIIRGEVPATLSQITSEKIAFLSIDMNCVEPEVATVGELWPRLVKAAVVLLDDYGGGAAYMPQKRAFDSLAAQMGFNILALPTGQGLIVRA